jgi:hypothetical protein
MTAGISGRPARCLANRFTAWVADVSAREIPAYPVAYEAGKALNAAGKALNAAAKALNAAAKAKCEPGYGAQWAKRRLRTTSQGQNKMSVIPEAFAIFSIALRGHRPPKGSAPDFKRNRPTRALALGRRPETNHRIQRDGQPCNW